VPDLSHLWHRFVLACALVLGLAVGVAATVFGYSNTATVNVGWSVFHLTGIPLWTVAIVPLVFVLVAGTLYHWWNSLHHFTEHMRHRRRVHELEAEVKSLRAHLDQLLEMPDHTTTVAPPVVAEVKAVAPPALPEPAVANGDDRSARKGRKRAALPVEAATEPVAVVNGDAPAETAPEVEPAESPAEA
jgi:hypothetical protein